MAKEIRQLPVAPDSANPATFNERADAFVKAMQPFADDANALAKELEEFSANVDTKSANVDTKYADLVQKYNDFITKYADFFAKYDIFVPAYLDVKSKHGEVTTTARTHKEYVDTLKTQIDEALERAKSFINEQNKVIDDRKVAETSTFSSAELVRRFNLKADDATAYREWNYKEISDDYTAQNNDALFVNTAKPITIALPTEGKIKIIDKAGNFSKFNVKLVGGDDEVFVLSKDFQKLELFKFSGKWRAVNGSLIRSFPDYGVSAKSINLFSGGECTNTKMSSDFFFGCGGENGVVVSLDTMTNILPATPAASGFTKGEFFFLDNDLCVYLYKHLPPQIKVFAFDTASKRFVERDATKINQKLSANYANFYLSPIKQQKTDSLYFYITKDSSSIRYEKILRVNSLSDVSEVNSTSYSSEYSYVSLIFKDIFFKYNNGRDSLTLQIPKNLITGNNVSIEGLNHDDKRRLDLCIDWTKNKAYFVNGQKTKALEIDLQTRNTKIVSVDASYSQTKPIPRIDCDKQDAYVTKDGLFFTDYQNFRKVTNQISVSFGGSDRSTPIVRGNKNYIVGIGEMLPKNLIEVTFTPKTFQEEI